MRRTKAAYPRGVGALVEQTAYTPGFFANRVPHRLLGHSILLGRSIRSHAFFRVAFPSRALHNHAGTSHLAARSILMKRVLSIVLSLALVITVVVFALQPGGAFPLLDWARKAPATKP